MDLRVDGVVEHQKDGITRNEDDAARHLEHPEGEVVFRRLPVGPGGDRVETPRFTHRSGRSPDWVKFKTPDLSAAT